ncbi:hypothetical protein FE257_000555 [Aspergillus nanangensis]|uniref:Carboxylesterase type B domain-containing protein n=1 Tax=Aspergillus nanangensis TaxID=2582783 RepID=A0AAD4GYT6_ASPNN|nr:hypothetical protein FE257_000555 [Aspergillus nanangensis]
MGYSYLPFLGAMLPLVVALNPLGQYGSPMANYVPPSNAKTSLTLLYQNNLNTSDHENHIGAILLDSMGQHGIREACEEIGETMLSRKAIEDHRDDFKRLFAYLAYSGRAESTQGYYIRDGVLSVTPGADTFDVLPFPRRNLHHPVLCTQSSIGPASTDPAREVRIPSDGNTYVGFRDQKSFRFLGIPYADKPQRFMYSTVYSPKSEMIQATNYGFNCAQPAGGSEDCLFLNIQTPFIPKQGSMDNLKPVLFWIHGGGFVSGTGSDPLTDGANLASREDIVVVSINYRLSTLGFLAVPETHIWGNFGLGDQVVALEWTMKNIAQFGGDPRRITIVGETAGAASVRALLASVPASGMFQGAVAMSAKGGGGSLELGSPSATPSTSYMTISESYKRAGKPVISAAGCDLPDLEQRISCLEQAPASTLVNADTVARYIVQDGHFVTGRELDLINKNDSLAKVPVMFGITADEGVPLTRYPPPSINTLAEGIQFALGIDEKQTHAIIDSGLFPRGDTGNLTLDAFHVAQRIATDLHFRCIDQASVFAGVVSGVFQPSYYYQMETFSADYYSNHVGAHGATPDFPNGDADLPYFRVHGSDLPWVFGTLEPLRDGRDLDAVQLVSAYLAEFVRSGQPNPPAEYLEARGYQSTLDAVRKFDRWDPVSHSEGPIQLLSYPSFQESFQDLQQCEMLGYPITYYFR